MECRGWSIGAGAVAIVAILLATAVPAAGQPDRDCWHQAWAVTGYDEAGNPTYGWEYVDSCRSDARSGGDGPRVCQHSTRGEVPCHDPVWGWWSDAAECYVSPLDPQPPAGDRLWEGHNPADGAVYQLRCPGDVLGASGVQGPWQVRWAFLPRAPGVPSVVQVTQRAMERLLLPAPDIGTAPDPDGAGLVALPVWLWITRDSWGPVSISIPGPGITVTAEGNGSQVEWEMGDGNTVRCDGPGTPYRGRYGGKEPECGYAYAVPSRTRPDGRYHITATTTWRVRWWVEPRGSGAEGEDYFFRSSTTDLRVNELHVVTAADHRLLD